MPPYTALAERAVRVSNSALQGVALRLFIGAIERRDGDALPRLAHLRVFRRPHSRRSRYSSGVTFPKRRVTVLVIDTSFLDRYNSDRPDDWISLASSATIAPSSVGRS